MGGPVFRSLAAVGTLGLSEAAQEKPFQDMGNDSPVNSMAGGPLRFIPGGAQIAGLMGMGTPEAPQPSAAPLDVTPAKDQKAAAAEELARRRAGGGRVSNMLTSPDSIATSSGTPQLRPFLGGF